MPKGQGLFGGIGKAIMSELMEGDDKAKKPASAPASAPAAPPPVAQQPVFNLPPLPGAAAPAAPASTSWSAPIPGPSAYTAAVAPAPEPLDDETMKVIQASVYTDVNGRKSHFLSFLKMWDALGRDKSPQMVLAALQVSNPDVTVATVLDDISAHNQTLEKVRAKAEADFTQAAQDRLGQKDQAVQALVQANQTALQEIDRHQHEMADRGAQIAALQQERATEEAAIARAKRQTEAAEAAVADTLQRVSTILSQSR